MKIQRPDERGIEFENLDNGDVFWYGGLYYIKINAPRYANNSVNLETGDIENFNPWVIVRQEKMVGILEE